MEQIQEPGMLRKIEAAVHHYASPAEASSSRRSLDICEALNVSVITFVKEFKKRLKEKGVE
jgi:hypothetical protein